VSLAGVALGSLVHLPPLFTATLASLVTALGVDWLSARQRLPAEASLSLFLSGGLAASAVLFSLQRGATTSLTSWLFGSLLTVSEVDVILIGVLTLLTGATLWHLRHALLLTTVDPDLARSAGIDPARVRFVFAVLAALTVAASLRTVGVLLVSALMVVPVLAARQLRVGARATQVASVGFSLSSVCVGVWLSLWLDLPSGACVVLTLVLVFLLVTLRRWWLDRA
jgi:zinc transport system permease protein